jgi:hypothetical protein
MYIYIYNTGSNGDPIIQTTKQITTLYQNWKKKGSPSLKGLRLPPLVHFREDDEEVPEMLQFPLVAFHSDPSEISRPSTPRPHKRTLKLSPMKRKLPSLRELRSTPGDLKNKNPFLSSSNITQKALPKIPSGKKGGLFNRRFKRSTKRRRG